MNKLSLSNSRGSVEFWSWYLEDEGIGPDLMTTSCGKWNAFFVVAADVFFFNIFVLFRPCCCTQILVSRATLALYIISTTGLYNQGCVSILTYWLRTMFKTTSWMMLKPGLTYETWLGLMLKLVWTKHDVKNHGKRG